MASAADISVAVFSCSWRNDRYFVLSGQDFQAKARNYHAQEELLSYR